MEQYRAEIQTFLGLGYSQAEIMRALKERYNVEVKRSTLSDYIKTLPEEGMDGALPGSVNGTHPMQAMPAEAVQLAAVMQGAGAELIEKVAQLIEGVQQMRQERNTQHAELMDTLQVLRLKETLHRHTTAFNALYRTLRGAALWPVWLRSMLVTGALWGVGLAGWYAWNQPAYAAKIRHVWHLIASYLP